MKEKITYVVISLLVISSLFLSYQVYTLSKQVKETATVTANIVNFLNQVTQQK